MILEFPFHFEISEWFKNFLMKIFVKYDIKKYDAKDLLNNYLVKEDIINEEKKYWNSRKFYNNFH